MPERARSAPVGIVGLGLMGEVYAQRLIQAGIPVTGIDIDPARTRRLADIGGRPAPSIADLAKSARCIILAVFNTDQVEDVVENTLLPALGGASGKIVLCMSTCDPDRVAALAGRVVPRGIRYLDAPVSGGEVGAKAASLTIMVGGPERAFNTMKPVFDKMGKNVTLVGANGDGQTTKVANQIIVALTIEAVGEALLFASKAGADPALVRQALMGGFASSRILEVHGERMVKRNFDPGFRIELHQKDLNLALEGARALGISLPSTAVAQQLFSSCTARGGKAWDHSGMVRALELLANHEIGKA